LQPARDTAPSGKTQCGFAPISRGVRREQRGSNSTNAVMSPIVSLPLPSATPKATTFTPHPVTIKKNPHFLGFIY